MSKLTRQEDEEASENHPKPRMQAEAVNAEIPNQATRVERWTSSRLRKDLILTTEDKTLHMGKKRNLEGTNLNNENSFSVLADDDIMHLYGNMGITIDESNFAAIDLVKELEIARHSLADKKIAPLETSNFVEPILEVLEEEVSEVESTTILTQRRKGVPRNSLSLSGKKEKEKRQGKSMPAKSQE